MPTLNVGYNDLCELVGRELPIGLLKEKLFLMKCEVDSLSGDELVLEVTSDRPDLLCAEGIARELRGLLGIETGLVNYKLTKSDLKIYVDKSISKVRPYIAGALVKKLEFTDDFVKQIMQLQEKLHLTYCRNRTKVSVGIHDAETITHKLTYAGVHPEKIRFTPLDETREMNGNEILESTPKGIEYGWIIKSFPVYPLLSDSDAKVLSLPPIINGIVTKVTPETTSLILDVTGTDMKLVNFVNNIMVSSLIERGGMAETATIIYNRKKIDTPDLSPYRRNLNLSYANEILGLDLKTGQASSLLRKMRYGVKPRSKNYLTVVIPAYRADIMHEIDLVEDLAIAYGYDKLDPTMPMSATIGSERNITKLTRKIRDLMVGLGFIEVLNYVMTSENTISYKMDVPSEKIVTITNPLSIDFSVLRNWLIPGLLSFLSFNKHVPYPQNIFECGETVEINKITPTKTITRRKLAALVCNHKISYENVQSNLYSLLRNAGANGWSLHRTEHSSFIKGRVASIKVSGVEAGIMGEIHPRILERFEIENPVGAFEIDLEKIFRK
ncbi:MAG: phenylalanine--tRNA ligase subunit beta [Candidatus Bathyarchaeia archaeon]